MDSSYRLLSSFLLREAQRLKGLRQDCDSYAIDLLVMKVAQMIIS